MKDTVVGGSIGPGLSGGQVVLSEQSLVWIVTLLCDGFFLETASGCSYSAA